MFSAWYDRQHDCQSTPAHHIRYSRWSYYQPPCHVSELYWTMMISRVNLRGCCVGSASRTCALHGAWRDTRCRAVYQGPVSKCILVNIQGGMACWPSTHHADGWESFKKYKLALTPRKLSPRAQAKKHMHMHAKSEKNPCPHENAGNKWGKSTDPSISCSFAHAWCILWDAQFVYLLRITTEDSSYLLMDRKR